jgi:hypothetical protein
LKTCFSRTEITEKRGELDRLFEKLDSPFEFESSGDKDEGGSFPQHQEKGKGKEEGRRFKQKEKAKEKEGKDEGKSKLPGLLALDIADSEYDEGSRFGMELVARVVRCERTRQELRYFGTVVLPVDGREVGFIVPCTFSSSLSIVVLISFCLSC